VKNVSNIIKLTPPQSVQCPHCKKNTMVEGIGQFKCINCKREFLYDGPFQIHCPKCGFLISLSPEDGGFIARCPKCGQKFDLQNRKKKPRKKKGCLHDCLDCCIGFGKCADDC